MTREERINSALLPILEKMREHGATDEMCEIYSNGFRVGAMWADSHPRWISVEDKLPKDGEYVLICNKRGLMTTSLYENEEWVISETYLAVNVTHWMPLPSVEHLKEGGEE